MLLIPLFTLVSSGLALGEYVPCPEALESMRSSEIEAHVRYLAAPELEGRDSPSRGLELAARYIAERFAAAELEVAPDAQRIWSSLRGDAASPDWSRPAGTSSGSYLRPFRTDQVRGAVSAQADDCSLTLTVDDETSSFAFGDDFVPIAGCAGEAQGRLVFAGFGIESKRERYNDLKGVSLRGAVALVLDGEPRHRSRFEGSEVTPEAALWTKLKKLKRAGAVGVILARRAPEGTLDDVVWTGPGLRSTYATWAGYAPDDNSVRDFPAIAVSTAAATRLLGTDVEAIARAIDKSGRPKTVSVSGRSVQFRAALETRPLTLDNVVACVTGSDPQLKDEWVIVGAHYDHIGIDARGRIGLGADDNASGTAALIEVAEALAKCPPRRSVMFAAFAAEEDGLIGSVHLAGSLPFERTRVAGMINLDMIGRGPDKSVVVLGIDQNPALRKVLEEARRLGGTGIRKLDFCDDAGLFRRSDHYSFHRLGIPALFFFENYPIGKNPDYHTWRDTVEEINFPKVLNTTRLTFSTVWILGNDDALPPRPAR